jgi:hypothetical protein
MVMKPPPRCNAPIVMSATATPFRPAGDIDRFVHAIERPQPTALHQR